MDAGFEAHLSVEGETVTERDVALLRAVAAEGSLNAAADALGRSYSRAHARISDLEERVGPLVERRRGGEGGGGSRLTGEARDLIARFERLQAALAGTATTERLVLEGTVVERTGDLVTVETAPGRVRALAVEELKSPGEAEPVQVSFRSDAVTLHAPAGAPDESDTSARNRFPGTVTDIERDAGTALVSVELGAADPLVVRVTEASLDRLAIEPGDEVVASFKATATRALSLGSARSSRE